MAAPEQKEKIVPIDDRQIYVIGPRKLQNELICSFLEEKCKATCLSGETLNDITDKKKLNSGQPKLLLWDCLGKDQESCLNQPEFKKEDIWKKNHIAFFNVNQAQCIEEKAMALGVSGLFYEDDPVDLFLKGVLAIFDGELWVPREVLTKCYRQNKKTQSPIPKGAGLLTTREIEILTLVCGGTKNEIIADRLCISTNTVKTHVYNIFKKINVPNRLQAALWAAKHLE